MQHLILIPALTLVPFALPAAAQCGQSLVEGFTNSSNVGNWAFGGPEGIQASGGLPAWNLLVNGLDTYAPQLLTQGASGFTGDYQAMDVTSLGVDFRTSYVDFPNGCARPLSLVLENDMGTPSNPIDDVYVYFVSTQTVGCPDGQWRSHTIDVPSQSATLPAGWNIDPNTSLPPDVAWNLVIGDVDRVRWFFGDPTFFFIFQMYVVAADNPRLATGGGPTSYCQPKLNSQNCYPALTWSGTPSASSAQPFTVSCSQVRDNKNGIYFYGYAPLASPFQGGVLCVAPPIERLGVQTSGGSAPCNGLYAVDFNAEIQGGNDPGLVPGATPYLQCWMRDPASSSAPTGLSNGLRFTICN